MKKIKLAIIYQVIFHYRIPFYQEIENDEEIQSLLLHGSGVKGTKMRNASHSLKNVAKVFSLRFPYKQNNVKKYFSFFPFLFFKLIWVNPKVILLEGSSSIINNISAFIYAKMFRKKVIYWSLGKVQNKSLSAARQKVDNLILKMEKGADAIFTYSSFGEQYFLDRGIPQKKIFKGINVVDTREILLKKPKEKKDENAFRILFIGSIIPEKKLETLIEAFLTLEKDLDNIYLDIIGSGAAYYDGLKEKYDALSENLIFHGRITEGLDEYYFKSDIFVLPGLGGLAISESMAYGLPIICSTADGTEKDLIDSESGFFMDEITPETLHTKITTLYNDRAHLKRVGVNAKNRIQTQYSFDNYYNVFKNSLKYVYEN